MKKYMLLVLLSFLFLSCGGYNTGILLKDHKGFLKFTGDINNISISINDRKPFKLEPDVDLYELNPGTYNVKVIRNENIVVNRTIILDEQITIEVEVP